MDLIDRQAAIEVAGRTDVRALTVEEVTMVTDAVIDGLKALPSHPEIIHCKDCKFSTMTYEGEVKYCEVWSPDDKIYMDGDNFCSCAERRGEQDG